MEAIGMTALETERLILRNYRESDLEDYFKLFNDEKNMYYLPGLVLRTLEEAQASLKDAMEANAKGTARRFAITIKGSDILIGGVGYEITYTTHLGKVADPMGWFLMPEYHNRGYMTEAVKRLLAFAFLQDNCVRVVTACFKDNVPSHKVIVKTGFRQEAEKIAAMYLDGVMRDRLEFALNYGEYSRC
jgi:ribosomal-protein-alanine N-acetyltransferase